MRNRTVTVKIRRNVCVKLLLKRFQIPWYWRSTPSIWLSKPSFPLLLTYSTGWISSYVCPLFLALERVSAVAHTDTAWIYTLISVFVLLHMCPLALEPVNSVLVHTHPIKVSTRFGLPCVNNANTKTFATAFNAVLEYVRALRKPVGEKRYKYHNSSQCTTKACQSTDQSYMQEAVYIYACMCVCVCVCVCVCRVSKWVSAWVILNTIP
jgi:hypothetical protein